MGRIISNKHYFNKEDIKSESFSNEYGFGEIIICNEVGNEGIYVLNRKGQVIKINAIQSDGAIAPEDLYDLINSYISTNYITSAATISLVESASGKVFSDLKVVSGILDTIHNEYLNEEAVANIVSEKIEMVVSGAPEAFDTLKEVADWIGDGSGKTAGYILQNLNNAFNKIQNNEGSIKTVNSGVTAVSATVLSALDSISTLNDITSAISGSLLNVKNTAEDAYEKAILVNNKLSPLLNERIYFITTDEYSRLCNNETVDTGDQRYGKLKYSSTAFYATYIQEEIEEKIEEGTEE